MRSHPECRFNRSVLACVDVDYRANGDAAAACLLFDDWTADRPRDTRVAFVDVAPAAYVPGALYRRELPCLLAVLDLVSAPLDLILVDAYVTLDPSGRPGLGAHLHEALGGSVSIVGVAKTRYAPATMAVPVLRGTSKTPLWITAKGLDPVVAAAHVRAMHGAHRLPTLLQGVDRLARSATRPIA